jgi:hypothetical protein
MSGGEQEPPIRRTKVTSDNLDAVIYWIRQSGWNAEKVGGAILFRHAANVFHPVMMVWPGEEVRHDGRNMWVAPPDDFPSTGTL